MLGVILIGTYSDSSGRAFEAGFVRSCRQRMRLQPQRAGGDGRIDTGLLPPSRFIATAMDLTVVAAAQRYNEFVAHLAPKRTMLCEPKVMRIRRLAPTRMSSITSG